MIDPATGLESTAAVAVPQAITPSAEAFPPAVLRDLFAMFAPRDIPSWFKTPELVIDLPAPADVSEIVLSHGDTLAKLFQTWCSDPAFDLDEQVPELAPFVKQQEDHWTAKREAERQRAAHREITWRWSYADLMMQARPA